MKISEILSKNEVTLSMEVFPPKTEVNFENVNNAVGEIADLKPAFVSCTYGAGGGTSKYTVEISNNIKSHGVEALSHLTCVSSSKKTVIEQIESIKEAGIDNILALRGDIPDGLEFPGENQFEHAIDLVNVIKETYPEACIGGACYPEKHPDALDKDEDIIHIREKVMAGCEFLTTQMFFDNSTLYQFLYRIREKGIDVPVLPGIMPITNAKQVARSVALSGSTIPQKMKIMVDRFADDPEKMKEAGIIYASDQIIDLISNGVSHIHVYSMNKPDIAAGIMRNLATIIK